MTEGGGTGSSAGQGMIGKTAEAIFRTAETPLASGSSGRAVLRSWNPATAAARPVRTSTAQPTARVMVPQTVQGSGARTEYRSPRAVEPRLAPMIVSGTPSAVVARDDPLAHGRRPDTGDQVGDHVDVSCGRVWRTETDVLLPGVLPVRLRRTHLSDYRCGRAFGSSWASTLDMRLEVDDQGVVCVCEDGMLLVYPRPSGWGAVLPHSGPAWPLLATVEGYEVTDPQAGVKWQFADGENHIAGPVGGMVGSQVVPLSAVTHRGGDRIEFASDHCGQIVQLVHSGGYQVLVNWDDERVASIGLVDAADSDHGAMRVLRQFGYTKTGLLAEVVNASGLSRRFEYDQDGRLTRWVDRNGRWYSYAFDERGRCVSTSGSGGFLALTLAYDDAANTAGTTTVTDAMGCQTIYTCNELSQVVRVIESNGGMRFREWDRYDQVLATADPIGYITRFRYDQIGNLVETTGPDGTVAVATYTPDGLLVSRTDQTGATHTCTYDNWGNVLQATDPTGAVTRYSYDEAGHLASMVDPLGAETMVRCDGAGLPLCVIDPLGATTAVERDAAGRVTRVVDPMGGVTTLTYTPEGKMASRTGPDGAVESWEHDPEGNLLAHTNSEGLVTRFEYTAFDRLSVQIDPDGARSEFAFDAQLRLTSVTNQQGLTWAYEYDAVGNLTTETDSDGRTLHYAYDLAGNLVAATNGLGETIHMARDPMGRVIARQTPEGRTDYQYDAVGRLVRAVSPTADLAFSYDPVGRIVAETVDGRTIRFSYDPAGRRAGRCTPTGLTLLWTYDARGGPTSLAVADHTLRFTYDAVGNLVDQVLATSTGWQIMRHTNNPAGKLLTRTLMAVTTDQTSLQIIVSQGRDPKSDSEPAAVSQGEREYEGTLLRRAGQCHFEYDEQRRVIRRRCPSPSGEPDNDLCEWRYTWDSDDRLVGVDTPDGARWSYRYDPLGRRLSKALHGGDDTVVERTDFTWDGYCLVEQTRYRSEGGPSITTWDYRPGTQTPIIQVERYWSSYTIEAELGQSVYTVVSDLAGNPTNLITVEGDIAWRAQGPIPSADGGNVVCPIRLPGQYHDVENGLYYDNQRYYDPTANIYLTPDVSIRGYSTSCIVKSDDWQLGSQLATFWKTWNGDRAEE